MSMAKAYKCAKVKSISVPTSAIAGESFKTNAHLYEHQKTMSITGHKQNFK